MLSTRRLLWRSLLRGDTRYLGHYLAVRALQPGYRVAISGGVPGARRLRDLLVRRFPLLKSGQRPLLVTEAPRWPDRGMDTRDFYLRQVVPGKSFVDVGGLWGTVNEKVSVAHAAGASSLAMLDVQPAGNWLWEAFDTRARELDLPAVERVSADVRVLAADPDPLHYDVVHCSGVLYHVADPIGFLQALRALANEWLVLTSAITRERIRTRAGTLRVPRGAALFVPALSATERAILRAHWVQLGHTEIVGITHDPPSWDPRDTTPWWWLPTPAAMAGLCRASGFQVEAGDYAGDGNYYTLLLRRA